MSEEIEILNTTKNTVGYRESGNRDEFVKGAQVAISKASDYYKKNIYELTRQLKYEKGCHESAVKDLQTLNSILNKYQSE